MTVRKKRASANRTKPRPSADTLAKESTRRVAAEAALRERDSLLALALEIFPGVLSRVDRDLRYRFASHGFERIFGVSPREIVGRTVQDVIGDKAFERATPYMERALAGE